MAEGGSRSEYRASFTARPDHPGFDGHFPGEPVFPAMCLVEETTRLLAAELGHAVRLVTLDRARFQRAVRPGDEALVELVVHPDGDRSIRVDARWTVAGRSVATLDLTVATGDPT